MFIDPTYFPSQMYKTERFNHTESKERYRPQNSSTVKYFSFPSMAACEAAKNNGTVKACFSYVANKTYQFVRSFYNTTKEVCEMVSNDNYKSCERTRKFNDRWNKPGASSLPCSGPEFFQRVCENITSQVYETKLAGPTLTSSEEVYGRTGRPDSVQALLALTTLAAWGVILYFHSVGGIASRLVMKKK